ncbi:MAG: TolC family protein, partial [Alphaproteobacteria bacterium]|nr:TolC family protein [Alphaproteobacteria bacterium]
MRRIALVFAIPTLLAGCTVGPEVKRPEVAGVNAPWVEPAAPAAVKSDWWTDLHDPQLDALIQAALAHNLDIAEAEAHLREARASRDAAAGGRLPQVNASASVNENGLSENGLLPINKIPGISRDYSLFDGGFDASWELDLWGGAKRTEQAAQAR